MPIPTPDIFPNEKTTSRGSPDRFGYSWDRYSELLPIHEEQFRRWTTPLTPAHWAGLKFLDVGCGMGRNSFWPLSYGAERGIAIDVDHRSLERARETLRDFRNVEIKYLSVYDLDIADEVDIAFSIGVIHHLENPAEAVDRMVASVKPGGRVLIWLYGREGNGWIIYLFNPLRRLLFSKLPLPIVHALSGPVAAILWLSLKTCDWGRDYVTMLRSLSFRHVRAIVFDHMIPVIARYYRRSEAVALLENAGLTEIEVWPVNGMSWTVIGRKA